MLRSLASLSRKQDVLELSLEQTALALVQVREQLVQEQGESRLYEDATADAVLGYSAATYLLQEATTGHASAAEALAGHLSMYQRYGIDADGQHLSIEAHHTSTELHSDPTFAHELAGTALPLATAPKRTRRMGTAILETPSPPDELATAAAPASTSVAGLESDPVTAAATGLGAAPFPPTHGRRSNAQGKRNRPPTQQPARCDGGASNTDDKGDDEPLLTRMRRRQGEAKQQQHA